MSQEDEQPQGLEHLQLSYCPMRLWRRLNRLYVFPLGGCRNLVDGSCYTNLLFLLVVCASDIDHVAWLVNCRLHFKGLSSKQRGVCWGWSLQSLRVTSSRNVFFKLGTTVKAPEVTEVGIPRKKQTHKKNISVNHVFYHITLFILLRQNSLSFCFLLSLTHTVREYFISSCFNSCLVKRRDV